MFLILPDFYVIPRFHQEPIVLWLIDRFRFDSFFSHNVYSWKKLPAEVLPVTFNVGRLKSNIHKHYSLFPPFHNLFSEFQYKAFHEKGSSPECWSKNKLKKRSRSSSIDHWHVPKSFHMLSNDIVNIIHDSH